MFDKLRHRGTCDVCGKSAKVIPAASIFGATSFSYCRKCFDKGVEPYSAMVSYIACAGHFPDDINLTYQTACRQILEGLGISEEQFIKDVDDAIENKIGRAHV